MHELGVVFHVVKEVEKVAEENKVNKVTKVTLEVGEVSTIVPDYFKECFEWSKKRTTYMKECELNLIVVQATSYCNDCKKAYSTTKYGKECPNCKSKNTYLVSGEQVSIKDIEVL